MSTAEKLRLPFRVAANTHNRDEWLAARRGIITASDVSAVLGRNPYADPLSVWLEKSGLAPEQEVTEAMEMGLLMEPVIAAAYERKTGRKTKPFQRLCVSEQYPWIGATCDAWTLLGGEDTPVEFKNASAYVADDWAEGCAPHYVPQVQTQMLVMGARRASVAVLIGGNRLAWCDVERDEEMIAEIIDATRDMMRRIQEGDAPPPSGSEASAAALAAMYPRETPGSVVALPGEAADLDAEILEQQAVAKRAEERVAVAKQKLQAMIGEAAKGVLPGGGAWSWSTQERKEYVVKASTSRAFRRVK